MKEKFVGWLKNLGVASYLCAVTSLLGVASLIIYMVYAASVDEVNGLIIAMLILGVASEVLCIWLGIDYVTLACPVLFGTALGGLAYSVYGTFVDLVNDVNFFGDITKLDIIITAVIFMGLTAVCAIAANFFKLRRTQGHTHDEIKNKPSEVQL